MNPIAHKILLFKKTGEKFLKDDGLTLAASLSFYAILSLIPLTLILISIFGHYLGTSEVLFSHIVKWIGQTLPGIQPDFIDLLKSLVAKKISRGYMGIAFLFFVASMLFSDIEKALNKIFAPIRTRNFWQSKLFSIGLIFLTAVLFFSLPTLSALVEILDQYQLNWGLSEWFSGGVFFFLGHTLFFFLALILIPRVRISPKSAIWGSVFFSLTTLFVREIFKFWVSQGIERYHFIYGSLTLLVLLILWIYYLSLIFIFSSELVSILENEKKAAS